MLNCFSNLTCANHIIFMSPYYTKGSNAQEAYNQAMTQAIGRARRYGQKRHVHIYHFLAAHTVDVDLFQQRQGKNVKIEQSSSVEIVPYEGFVRRGATLVDPAEGDYGELSSPIAYLMK